MRSTVVKDDHLARGCPICLKRLADEVERDHQEAIEEDETRNVVLVEEVAWEFR